MSEEEKKEYIEHEILDRLYCLNENDFNKEKVDESYIKAVLRAGIEAKELIEKQQKEIEELRAINEMQKYRIEDLREFNKIQQEDYIIKDKIREHLKKFEEIEKEFIFIDNKSTAREINKALIEFSKRLLEE